MISRATASQFLRFAIVGGAGFVVDTAMLYSGIYILGLSRVAAAFFAFPFSVTFTWAGNRFFTYRHAKHDPVRKQLLKFMIVCGAGLVFNRGTYALLVHYVPLVFEYPVLGLAGGTAVGMFFNFFMTRKHVFGA